MRYALVATMVILLLVAWWPWNVWLILISTAYASGWQYRHIARLFARDGGDPLIGNAQIIKQTTITRDDTNTPQDHGRIVRRQHFRNPPRYTLIDARAAGPQGGADRLDSYL
jgi:hypothetical protein